MAAGLRIEGLTLARGGRTLVDALDVDMAPGSVLAVTGQAGSGKSTLLAALAGLTPLDSGRVLLDGTPPDPLRAGIVMQEHVLLGGLTAAENVVGRVLARRKLRDGDWPAVLQLLGRLGLPESSHHNLLEQLSGGQQQRVAVARALVDDPPLLVLDDPTSELDATTAELVWNEVAAAVERGAIAVVAFPEGSGGPAGDQQVRL